MHKFSIWFFVSILVILGSSCTEKGKDSTAENSTVVENKPIKKKSNIIDIVDCYAELKTIGKLLDQKGSVYLVGDKFVILTENEAIRYHVCNLPTSYAIDGLSIYFSAVTKEIPMNAKMVGLPAVLTKIRLN